MNQADEKNTKHLYAEFLKQYDANAKDEVWRSLSAKFRTFWRERILSESLEQISQDEVDEIVRILDRNAKGNKKDSEAVARAMVAQGAWRRMFSKLHGNKAIAEHLWKILEEADLKKKSSYIDQLYEMNDGKINNLTGPSGNTINAMLCAYDPLKNSSMISLNDRRTLVEYFKFSISFDFDESPIGDKIVQSNIAILEGFQNIGLDGSARSLSSFCYYPPMKSTWKIQHTVKRVDRDVPVTVPTRGDTDESEIEDQEEVRESLQIQGLLADIGSKMGMRIWLPKSDRSRVLKVWNASEGDLLDKLPLNYDSATLKTIEQIDVLWLKKRSIVRAFEVEHTTSIYSGILRMADLLALQPNMKIKLHIVAPSAKREKVIQEIGRPVFTLLDTPLRETCTYISYDSLRELAKEKHLDHLSDSVLDEFEEETESD